MDNSQSRIRLLASSVIKHVEGGKTCEETDQPNQDEIDAIKSDEAEMKACTILMHSLTTQPRDTVGAWNARDTVGVGNEGY
jgi:hypothetical protein